MQDLESIDMKGIFIYLLVISIGVVVDVLADIIYFQNDNKLWLTLY